MSRKVVQIEEKLPVLTTVPLSLQHLFAMFGATVLIPVLLGVNPATQILFNGIGTLLYIVITKGRIPAYLGPSAAFISGIAAITASYGYGAALVGCAAVGIIFVIAGFIIRGVGMGWIDVIFPPAVMGAVVAVIGLELAPLATGLAGLVPGKIADPVLAQKTIMVSMFTLGVAIIVSTMFRGFLQVIPVLIAVAAGYIFALTQGIVDTSGIAAAPWFAVPPFVTPVFNWNAIFMIAPAALVVIAEHVGHLVVTENITGRELKGNNGLSNSLVGNGVATFISSMFGALPETTYGENIGVMAITKVYSVWVIGGAAVISIVLAFIGKLAALIQSLPGAVMGGVSILLFGIIAASGLRMLIEAKVDYSKSRNLILSAVVLIMGVGGAEIVIGPVTLKGMGLATVVGILLALFFRILDAVGIKEVESADPHASQEEGKVA